MNQKRRGVAISSHSLTALPVTERCDCQPLSSLYAFSATDGDDYESCEKQVIPVATALSRQLRTQVESMFSSTAPVIPVSILLLHVSQVEQTPITPHTALVQKRYRYHAPEGVLDQVMVNVRRAIRAHDQVLLQQHVGAVLLFPHVDQQGAYSILERVYNSVSLLQAETIIPPLRRETSILMGIGTTHEQDTSLEPLLYRTGRAARCFTLRPAITTHSWDEYPSAAPGVAEDDEEQARAVNAKFPFMQLPPELPTRLKHLLPYTLAVELRCVPVGRNHHCLTVAMSNPTNTKTVRRLAELTGMTVFPVSCDDDALDALLEQQW